MSDPRQAEVRQFVAEAGRLSRREVIGRGLALGLSVPAIGALLAARPDSGAGSRRRDDEDRLHARSAVPRSAAGAVGPGPLALHPYLRSPGAMGRDDARSATGHGRVVDHLGRQSDLRLHPPAGNEIPQRQARSRPTTSSSASSAPSTRAIRGAAQPSCATSNRSPPPARWSSRSS